MGQHDWKGVLRWNICFTFPNVLFPIRYTPLTTLYSISAHTKLYSYKLLVAEVIRQRTTDCIDVAYFACISLNVHIRRMKQRNIKSLDLNVAKNLYFLLYI